MWTGPVLTAHIVVRVRSSALNGLHARGSRTGRRRCSFCRTSPRRLDGKHFAVLQSMVEQWRDRSDVLDDVVS